jgi:sugar phosphate isomerase/epimerase
MNRRDFLKTTPAGGAALAAVAANLRGDVPGTTMGVVQYSFSRNPHTRSALDFLEYCHSLGAGGVQVSLDSIEPHYTARIRSLSEQLGMYFEAILGLPRGGGAETFERYVIAAKQAGASCARVACLSGRRYENFSSLAEWKQFVVDSHRRLDLAVPILEKHKLAAGIENHKDWTANELVGLIRKYSSEYLGACIDAGNNLAMLDDPMDLVRKLAPYAVSTHFKDMAVEPYADGFLLSGVPLGRGILDLRHMIETIHRARPRTHFSLEMITRDPLKVPCLTDKYWVTFPGRNGVYLARTLRLVRDDEPLHPLPTVSGLGPAARQKAELENVVASLRDARENLGLTA